MLDCSYTYKVQALPEGDACTVTDFSASPFCVSTREHVLRQNNPATATVQNNIVVMLQSNRDLSSLRALLI